MNQNNTTQPSSFSLQPSTFARELRPLLRLAQSWLALLIVFAALGLALLLSYQARPSVDLPIDSPLIVGHHGEPFFSGLYDIEKAKNPDGSLLYPYRWTQPDFTLELPGLGQQPFTLTMSLSGSRPTDQPPAVVTITVGAAGQERPLARFSPEARLREYSFLIPASTLDNGDLRVVVSSDGFHPSSDNRDLGLIFNRARLTPAPGGGFILPPLHISLWLALALALLLLGLARLGWGNRTLMAGGLLFALASGLWLAFDRLFLTSVAPYLWQALLAAYIGLLIADYILRLLRQYRGELANPAASPADRPWSVAAVRWLLTIFFAAFAIRLGGQLHPQIMVVDLYFHVHRLEDVLRGTLLFRTFASESGGHTTFYLPTTYVPLAPFSWLFGSSEAGLAMAARIFAVALDCSAIFLVATIGRLAASQRAGIGAAYLYVSVPIGILPFSWGIVTNIFGQYVLLWLLALLVSGVPEFAAHPHPSKARWRPSWQIILFLFFLTIALLSHPGVVPLTIASLGLPTLAWGLSALRRQRQWHGVVALVGVGVLAALLAFGFYYRNTISATISDLAAMQQNQTPKGGGPITNVPFVRNVGGAVNDPSIGLTPHLVYTPGQWLGEGIIGLFKEAWGYFAAWPIFAAFGFALLWGKRKSSAPAARLFGLMLVWVAVACIFAAIGLLANLYVRYALYLLPMVALGGGIMLAQLWRESWGRPIALLLGGFTVAAGLLLWYNRIMFYLH